jgi:uncharacterized RDD family membrane protein YckC
MGSPVKCPECGFDSPPGSARCANCGRLLGLQTAEDPVHPQEASSSSLASGSAKAVAASAGSRVSEERAGPVLSRASVSRETPEQINVGRIVDPQTGTQPSWQEELSGRVEDYRRRRARLKGGPDRGPNLNLIFDFDEASKRERDSAGPGLEVDNALIAETTLHSETGASVQESIVGIEGEAGPKGTPLAEEVLLESPSATPKPLEIVLGAPSEATESSRPPLELAPLRQRLLGGVIDGVILLSAGGIFAVVFWLVGGHASANLVNELALGFIAVFVFLTYFGMFTMLTSSTPGLSFMGLEVRNLEGNYPTRQEALWRAFGYLVSTSAMMLGFVWAVFDSDGLTWHDRMSGTFVSAIRA